jgi:hypothetical protein
MNDGKLKGLLKKGAAIRRLKPTLAQTVVLSCLVGVIGSCFIAGYNAQSLVQKSKLVDNWAIMFLESENIGYRLRDVLSSFMVDKNSGADLQLTLETPGQPLSAKTSNETFQVSISQLGFDSESDLLGRKKNESTVVFINGSIYLIVEGLGSESKLSLKKVPVAVFSGVIGRADKKARTVYLVSRQGRIIYSSDAKINNETFLSRELVKKFLQSSLSGQIIEYQSSGSKRYYGAAQEITGTNMVLFSEVSRDLLIGSMTQSLQQYALLVVVLVTIIIVLISLPIARLSNSLSLLTRFVRHLSTGDLSPRVKITDCQETAILGESLNDMAQSITYINASYAAEVEDKFLRATGKIRREIHSDVTTILQSSISSNGPKKFSVALSYLEEESGGSTVCFDLGSSQGSIQSTFLSEVRADLAESMIYQSVVGGIINNAFKTNFEDIKTVIRKIDDVPALLNQTSVESSQYHLTKDQRGSDVILKIWSRFGLSVFGIQAQLTPAKRLDFEKSSMVDLGTKTVFEASLPARPGSVVVLACLSSPTPAIRDLQSCSSEYKDAITAFLSEVEIIDNLYARLDDPEKLLKLSQLSGHLGILVIGNFQ